MRGLTGEIEQFLSLINTKPSLERVDPVEALEEGFSEVKGESTETEAEVSADGGREDEATDILADRRLLKHLFVSVFRFADREDRSDVSVEITDGSLVIRDPGLPSSIPSGAWEPGYSSGSGGSGLAVVRQVCETHGWEISDSGSDSDSDVGVLRIDNLLIPRIDPE
ncbi:MAG: hypothetical protein SV253_03880 [Halobacteria archaeon]|nr:hypothetical protein [Halobacteria archaeon]